MTDTFLADLSPGLAKQLRDAGSIRTYPARSYLSHEGDRSSSVLIVLSGLLRIDRTTPGGRIVLLNLEAPGGLVGELGVLDDAPRSATTSAVTHCSVSQIAARRFRELMRAEPALNDAVLGRLTRRLRALSTQFLETSTMDAPSRIAARLVRLVDIEQQAGRSHVDPDGAIDMALPINQEELGQWSGLSREGAVKGLAVLRSDGIIETGRKRVRVLDLGALQTRAAPI